jgi:hypothetical protein
MLEIVTEKLGVIRELRDMQRVYHDLREEGILPPKS